MGGMQNGLGFRVEINIYSTSVLGSNLTWFYVGDRSWLCFGVRTEVDFFFVRGSKLTLYSLRVENYLFLV